MPTDVAEILDEPVPGNKSLQLQNLWVPAEKHHNSLESVLLYYLETYRTNKICG